MAAHNALRAAAQGDSAIPETSTDDDRLIIDEQTSLATSGDNVTSVDETDSQRWGASDCNRARDELKWASRQTDSDASASKTKKKPKGEQPDLIHSSE